MMFGDSGVPTVIRELITQIDVDEAFEAPVEARHVWHSFEGYMRTPKLWLLVRASLSATKDGDDEDEGAVAADKLGAAYAVDAAKPDKKDPILYVHLLAEKVQHLLSKADDTDDSTTHLPETRAGKTCDWKKRPASLRAARQGHTKDQPRRHDIHSSEVHGTISQLLVCIGGLDWHFGG